MDQLVERSLLIPKICGSNPGIGKIKSTNCTEQPKMKKRRLGMVHLKKVEPILFKSKVTKLGWNFVY